MVCSASAFRLRLPGSSGSACCSGCPPNNTPCGQTTPARPFSLSDARMCRMKA